MVIKNKKWTDEELESLSKHMNVLAPLFFIEEDNEIRCNELECAVYGLSDLGILKTFNNVIPGFVDCNKCKDNIGEKTNGNKR